jgi:putative zinc finger/helix-turn-helix YgiT family protein
MTPSLKPERVRGNRPFPWKCPVCLSREVYPAKIPYTLEVAHDGVTHTVHVPALEVPQCRSCGELLFNDGADEQINEALRSQLCLLAPDQIRRRRTELGLSQSELADKLGVPATLLMRWETGAMIPSRAMDNLLRIYFALPEVRAALAGKAQDPLLGATDRHTLPSK